MTISTGQFDALARDVRGLEGEATAVVAGLVAQGVWTGDDADRFERDWLELVTRRLRSAADALDAVSVSDLPDGAL